MGASNAWRHRKGWWFHLRRCAKWGHIGCCGSSPSQHASKHATKTRYKIIASFEPREDWFYDYEKQAMIEAWSCLRRIRIRGSSITWTGRESSSQ